MANHRRVGLAWRKDPEVLSRLPEVGRRMLRRETHVQIATALAYSTSAAHQDMKRVRELWAEHIQQDQATLRSQIVAELDDARARALAAAEFDEQAERAVLYGGVVEIDGKQAVVYRDNKGSAQFRGNKAAAIGQARQASMDKAKLLGLVVDKAALTDAEGNALDFVTLARALNEAG